MRLPLVPSLDSRDGVSNKDESLTNVLAEPADGGGQCAAVRPGLVSVATSAGNGNGLVCFNGELVSVYGTTLGLGTVSALATITGDNYDFAQSTL